MSMKKLDVAAKRGVVLNGVLFSRKGADTVVIAITGIHGNFYSNPFYYNIGNTLNEGGFDFIYVQTNDAFGRIQTFNVNTGKDELIGSWNERFCYADEDIDAYLSYATQAGYRHIFLRDILSVQIKSFTICRAIMMHGWSGSFFCPRQI